jgi:hypothetical protein
LGYAVASQKRQAMDPRPYEIQEKIARDEFPRLDARQIRDLRPDVLGPDGRLRVLPAAFWAATVPQERALFGANTGTYSFPTVELVERLREIIAGRSAIEIGAGHGVLAEALGITGTDSYQHHEPKYRALYEQHGLKICPYGSSVVEMHASRAVRRYKPQVVIGCWCTHKYDPKKHERGGNEVGVDEPDVLRNCETYVLVGHESAHRYSGIWERKHTVEFPPYVYSRALEAGRDFIAIVEGAHGH